MAGLSSAHNSLAVSRSFVQASCCCGKRVLAFVIIICVLSGFSCFRMIYTHQCWQKAGWQAETRNLPDRTRNLPDRTRNLPDRTRILPPDLLFGKAYRTRTKPVISRTKPVISRRVKPGFRPCRFGCILDTKLKIRVTLNRGLPTCWAEGIDPTESKKQAS